MPYKDEQKQRKYFKEYAKKYRQRPKAKLWAKNYNQKPEVKLKKKEYSKKNRQKPETKAKRYAYNSGIAFEIVLPYFLNLERICIFCGESGGTHLDHNHNTLEIRGWAHQICNSVEGMVLKSPNPTKLVAKLNQLNEEYLDWEDENPPRRSKGSLPKMGVDGKSVLMLSRLKGVPKEKK